MRNVRGTTRSSRSTPSLLQASLWGTLVLAAIASGLAPRSSWAACAASPANDKTWIGTSTSWTTASNWSPTGVPAATHNVLIEPASRTPALSTTPTVVCFELKSGATMSGSSNGTGLIITGDYFKNPNAGSLSLTSGRTITFTMAGTAPQTFENQDPINHLTISNNTSVTLTRGFTVRGNLSITGSATTVYVNGDVVLSSATTVPSGVTIEVGSGYTLSLLANLTVNGTLTIKPGARVAMASGTTLTVSSGGQLRLEGASGNVATLEGNGGNFTAAIAGTIYANYFRISRTTAAGLNITGTISQMNYGEFHFPPASGYAMTFGAATSLPASMTDLGFFNDLGNAGVRSINATSYNLANVTLSNWSGQGSSVETDPNNRIDWGAQAPTTLSLSNLSGAGTPSTTLTPGTTYTFGVFGFSLNQSATATDITSLTFTQYGTAYSADVDQVLVYRDVDGNCAYTAGTDTQIGSTLTLSGSPPVATVSIPPGSLSPSTHNAECVIVRARIASTARSNATVGFKIAETADVTNSQGYTFTSSSGPPVSAGLGTISGSTTSWRGTSSSVWTTNGNWTNNAPSTTRDCEIGPGSFNTVLGANRQCRNALLISTGTTDFTGNYQLQVGGSLTVEAGHTFLGATAAQLSFTGTATQSLNLGQAFPGHLVVGPSSAPSVNVDSNSTINGNLTITQGSLTVTSGHTLTVLGNITVSNTASLIVQPGGTLQLANGRTLTVNSGGTLQLVGTAAQTAMITSTGTTASYSIIVNGTIRARYYTLNRMGVNGLTINSGATIDSTNFLQNGSFAYPVNNSSTFLRLYRAIPGNTLSGMSFDSGGSSASLVRNIYTDATIPAGTLSITSYTGDWSGSAYDNDSTYAIVWSGATNTIDITRDAAGANSSLFQGNTYVMGRFSFQQSLSGASYTDANLSTLKLTLTGTATASDIGQVRIYYDSTCAGSGGTLLGSGTFSGTPATVTFTGLTGATVPSALFGTPAKRCVYVAYDIAAAAVNANTAGVEIASAMDVVFSPAYGVSGSTPPPINLGTPATIVGTTTTWIGGTAGNLTNWFTASNWNNGVPNSTLNCLIPNVANKPVINGASGTATCKNVNINASSSLTLTNGTSAVLEVHGSFTNAGTFSQNDGTLRFAGSTGTNQVIASNGASLGTVRFNKTGGGTVIINSTHSSFTINSLQIGAGNSFEFLLGANQTLTLPQGLSLASGTFTIPSAGTLAIGAGQSIAVSGGTFRITGINDGYPQATTNKGKITVSGSGRWGFSATGGTLSFTGFIFDSINESGLQIGGTANLTALNGGQFTHLSTSYASVKAIQLNSATGTLPATATNVGWNWAPGTPPTPAQSYYLAASTGCGGRTIAFDQWFGDFFVGVNNPVTQTKVSAVGCTITIDASASPVSLRSLSATPYDGAVSIDWQTGSELDHQGFNVYRSSQPTQGYVQVNPSLIRRVTSESLTTGRYRFVDNSVQNGFTYYYLIEDVATNNAKTRHGPIQAQPSAALGPVPATAADTNGSETAPGGDTGNEPSTGTIGTPGLIDLGNGVHLLSQSRTSLRIEVVPPAAQFSTSSWNAAYQTVQIPGYSAITQAGEPELLERSILIEVPATTATAEISDAAVTESSLGTHTLAPAPSWTPDSSGNMIPSYAPLAAAYSNPSFAPSAYYTLDPQVISVGDQRFLKLRVSPLQYQATSSQVKRLDRLVLDIGLDGSAWSASPTPVASRVPASAAENALRIRYRATGVYELKYEDLAAAQVEGPSDGRDSSQFRLYQGDEELPIEVLDADSSFGPGDSLRFFAWYTPVPDDLDNEVVLSRYPLLSGASSPLRIRAINADPSGLSASTALGSPRRVLAEQDLYAYLDGPLGDGFDHFHWKKIFIQNGQAATANAQLDLTANLPGLLRSSQEKVELRFYFKGNPGNAVNLRHHVSIFVNRASSPVGDLEWDGTDYQVLSLKVPSQYFFDGLNKLRIKVLGDRVPPGDWDIVSVDKLEIQYTADHLLTASSAELLQSQPGTSLEVRGLTSSSSATVYDISDLADVQVLQNLQTSLDSATGRYTARFAAHGRRYFVFEAAALRMPVSLRIAASPGQLLRSDSQRADLLVIGPESYLLAARDLIRARERQGLRVVQAPLEQVYAEFSQGLKSAQGIRELIRFAHEHWARPGLRYVLFLGLANYDPKNHQGLSAVEPEQDSRVPMPLQQGLYLDFGGDHWFVEAEESRLPIAAVGRIPARSEAELEAYVKKLLDYESGARAPQNAEARRLVFMADQDTVLGEGFAAHAANLAQTASATRPEFRTEVLNRATLGSDALTKSALEAEFGRGPLLMTLVGHGAEDRWASDTILANSSAEQLAHERLPIVVMLNCLSAYFYDPDLEYRSLGEKLVLNPEGGAIAFWGSTTMTQPAVQVQLSQAMLENLARSTSRADRGVRLGDLALRAKLALGDQAATADTLRSWTLLGDPSMPLPEQAMAPQPIDGGGISNAKSSSDERKSGFGLGCGSIRDHRDGGGPGGSAGAATEFAGLMLAFFFSYAFARRFRLAPAAATQR